MFIIYVFAFVGLFFMLSKIVEFIKIQNTTGRLIYVLEICGRQENIEYILRKITNKMKWLQGNENKSIICIDNGMDEETFEIIKNLQKDNSMIKIVKSRR